MKTWNMPMCILMCVCVHHRLNSLPTFVLMVPIFSPAKFFDIYQHKTFIKIDFKVFLSFIEINILMKYIGFRLKSSIVFFLFILSRPLTQKNLQFSQPLSSIIPIPSSHCQRQ